MTATLAIMLLLVSTTVSFVGFVMMVYYAVKTIANLQPGIDLMDTPWSNPLCPASLADRLTERGLKYRRKMLCWGAVYVLPPFIWFAVALARVVW